MLSHCLIYKVRILLTSCRFLSAPSVGQEHQFSTTEPSCQHFFSTFFKYFLQNLRNPVFATIFLSEKFWHRTVITTFFRFFDVRRRKTLFFFCDNSYIAFQFPEKLFDTTTNIYSQFLFKMAQCDLTPSREVSRSLFITVSQIFTFQSAGVIFDVG